MSHHDHIVIIGYRGTGKTTVARQLADRLGWHALDTDQILTAGCGCSIAEVFSIEGEARFRELEAAVIEELAPTAPTVVSVGGGAVLSEANRRRLSALGAVVWLNADVDTLVGRLAADPQSAAQRPPLSGDAPRAEIETLLARRKPLYEKMCTIRVDTTGLTPEDVCDVIVRELEL